MEIGFGVVAGSHSEECVRITIYFEQYSTDRPNLTNLLPRDIQLKNYLLVSGSVYFLDFIDNSLFLQRNTLPSRGTTRRSVKVTCQS